MAEGYVLHTRPIDPASVAPPDEGGYDHCAVKLKAVGDG